MAMTIVTKTGHGDCHGRIQLPLPEIAYGAHSWQDGSRQPIRLAAYGGH